MIEALLKRELIMLDVELSNNTKETAISKISESCSAYCGIDKDVLQDMFLQREALDSTGFGNQVAIPHAKIMGLKDAFIGIFKFKEAAEWEAIDDEPVKVAIALVMPGEAENNTHIQVLSKFSRKLMDDDFIETLISETDADKLYEFVIKEMEG